MKPKVYVATPCYDSMRIETCVSLIDMFFMDSKSNWNNEKTYEDLKEEALEEMLMGSLIKGEMGFA